jgi:sulfur carrier protein ThiS
MSTLADIESQVLPQPKIISWLSSNSGVRLAHMIRADLKQFIQNIPTIPDGNHLLPGTLQTLQAWAATVSETVMRNTIIDVVFKYTDMPLLRTVFKGLKWSTTDETVLKYEMLQTFFQFGMNLDWAVPSDYNTDGSVSLTVQVGHNYSAFPSSCTYVLKIDTLQAEDKEYGAMRTVFLGNVYDKPGPYYNVTININPQSMLGTEHAIGGGNRTADFVGVIVPIQCTDDEYVLVTEGQTVSIPTWNQLGPIVQGLYYALAFHLQMLGPVGNMPDLPQPKIIARLNDPIANSLVEITRSVLAGTFRQLILNMTSIPLGNWLRPETLPLLQQWTAEVSNELILDSITNLVFEGIGVPVFFTTFQELKGVTDDSKLKFQIIQGFFQMEINLDSAVPSDYNADGTVSIVARIGHNPLAFPDTCRYAAKFEVLMTQDYPNASIYYVDIPTPFNNKQSLYNVSVNINIAHLLGNLTIEPSRRIIEVNGVVAPTQCAANIVQNQDAVKRIITGMDMQPQTKSVTDAVAAHTTGVGTASMGFISDTYRFQVNSSSATTLSLGIAVPKVYADQATPMGRRLLQSTSEITCRMGGFYKVSLFLSFKCHVFRVLSPTLACDMS